MSRVRSKTRREEAEDIDFVEKRTTLPRVADPGIKVVWRPLPGSQALALSAPCDFILYEGTRGPGKTDCQLMRFRRLVGKGYGRFWRGLVWDREYKNLDDLVQKSLRWFPQFGDGAQWKSSGSDYKWVWPTGEELLFRAIKKESDYWNYHGHEYPFLAPNELTKNPTSQILDMMMSCNRTSFVPLLHSPVDPDTGVMRVLPPIPLEVFATTNPYGPGHVWVKRRYIDPSPPGVPVVKEIEVFNPRTQKRETVRRTQVRVFGSYKENRFLTPEYVAELESITDENKRRAWLWGDWDVMSGGALDDVWREMVHVIDPIRVPASWRVDRSFDWGSSHPFSVGWWAEASGEEARFKDGSTFCPPRGSLVQIGEWYGTKEIGSNLGLRMSAADVARGILDREQVRLLKPKIIMRKPHPGPADNQIRDVREADVESIEKKMADLGVRWTPSDKSAGSRRNGLQLIRDRLENAVRGEGPGLFFTRDCQASIQTLPVLPRDEKEIDDVDTDAEDHPYDMVRYRVLASSNRLATSLKTTQAH